MQQLLTMRDVYAGYSGKAVVHGIDLELERGEIVGLLGPNGSGKTTLLRVASGLLAPQCGEVLLDGLPLASLPLRQRARWVAIVPQRTELGFDVPVRDAVTLGRYPYVGAWRALSATDREAGYEAMEALDLLGLADRNVRSLSGGEQQRVFLARALAQATPILLLDEPLANLDVRYQQETYERLNRLAAERGLGILVADHHLNLAAAFCDRLVVLDKGRLWASGPPAQLLTEQMIAEVFGARMWVRGRADSAIPECGCVLPESVLARHQKRGET